ncbi:MAG: fibronectin type III domain-containing protein, partial [Anaerohalosphaeraceae bacterium]
SYQAGNLINGYTYSFRIRAVNEFGYSDYSNTVSRTISGLIYSLKLNTPNGEKDLAAEAVYPIMWGSYNDPPEMVNLYYSLDGGSNWTTIVSNYPNTGYYYWKLPAETTSECIVKVAKSDAASSYDLTDTAFKIQGYDFDRPGGAQGWTVTDVYDEDGYPIDAGFRFNWRDPVDYPAKPGADPAGNLQGTIAIIKNTAGIIYSNLENILAKYWYQDVISPDLTNLEYWQQASGVRIQIAHCMKTNAKLYSNMIIQVYDTDLNQTRYFTYPSSASQLSYCKYNFTNVWNGKLILFRNLAGFPEHYILKHITVRIWGDLGYQYDDEENGSVFLDNIFPVYPATDYDCDGDTDIADFSALSSAWDTAQGDPTWNPIFDPYNSGLIDIYELREFVSHWLEGTE